MGIDYEKGFSLDSGSQEGALEFLKDPIVLNHKR